MQATSSLFSELSSANAVVITSPGNFTESALVLLYDYVNDDGVLFLHGESDYNDYDDTENLNDIASYLQRALRFDDGLVDLINNVDGDSTICTPRSSTSRSYCSSNTANGDGGVCLLRSPCRVTNCHMDVATRRPH